MLELIFLMRHFFRFESTFGWTQATWSMVDHWNTCKTFEKPYVMLTAWGTKSATKTPILWVHIWLWCRTPNSLKLWQFVPWIIFYLQCRSTACHFRNRQRGRCTSKEVASRGLMWETPERIENRSNTRRCAIVRNPQSAAHCTDTERCKTKNLGYLGNFWSTLKNCLEGEIRRSRADKLVDIGIGWPL